MKRIALVHTVKPVLNTFEDRLRAAMPDEELIIHNLLDEFLAYDPSPDGHGYFTAENKRRLYNDLMSAQLTGADIIVVTCSTLTPTVTEIRPFMTTPVVAIDDAMAEAAVQAGSNIKVVATAFSTIAPTIARLQKAAADAGKTITIDSEDNEPAYCAMKKGDMATHDAMVKEQAASVKGYDAVVLAQASMAHLEADVAAITGIPTFSSPDRCVQRVKSLLGL
ncbi:MAG: aspartate/glutamate racemase family protein [Angelakisella sp.]|nr:aspartate/glutamate racemase family protein [Angelakisella sp.]